MGSPRIWSSSLTFAAVIGGGMALYHFVLPYHMGWRSGLVGTPDSIAWALFALNFSWSLLVLLAELLVLYAAKLGSSAGTFARRTVFIVGLFWALHGAYTWLNPLPLPPALVWLRYVLGAFPVVVVVLHWLPLVANSASSQDVSSRERRASTGA